MIASNERRPAGRRRPVDLRAVGPDKRRMELSGTLGTSRFARSRPQTGEGTVPAKVIVASDGRTPAERREPTASRAARAEGARAEEIN
jgi:hypothetical protein